MLFNDVRRPFPSGRFLIVLFEVSWPVSSESSIVLRFNQWL
jgi:hypothetical protein